MLKKYFWKIKLPLAAVFFALGILGVSYKVHADPKIFKIDVEIRENSEIKPQQEVVADFSDMVIPATFTNNISVIPSQQISFVWENDNKRLKIKPIGFWKPETEYRLIINGGKSALFMSVSAQLYFQTIDYPTIKNFYPLNGEKNVILDMESPISATFDKPLDDFKVKFIVEPMEKLAYSFNPDKTSINLLLKDEFKQGENYSISIYLKYKDEDEKAYKKIYTTSFETFFPPEPEVWDKDPQIMLKQAKQFTKPQISDGKYIDINLAKQVMVIFENGIALDSYQISSGKRGLETPVGIFAIQNKSPRAWSKKYALFMPNWMAFLPSGEMGIHELPVWPGGYQEGANHLGTPVSHGCVRLGVGAAKRVYEWAELKTPVVIH